MLIHNAGLRFLNGSLFKLFVSFNLAPLSSVCVIVIGGVIPFSPTDVHASITVSKLKGCSWFWPFNLILSRDFVTSIFIDLRLCTDEIEVSPSLLIVSAIDCISSSMFRTLLLISLPTVFVCAQEMIPYFSLRAAAISLYIICIGNHTQKQR